MKNKLIFTFIIFTLLLIKFGTRSSSNNLVGIWNSDCQSLNNNNKYTAKTAYTSDGSFNIQTESKSFFAYNVSFSGTYKFNGNRLSETITETSKIIGKNTFPFTQISDLEWVDNDSFITITGDRDKYRCLVNRSSK